jgi:hypothetical protein
MSGVEKSYENHLSNYVRVLIYAGIKDLDDESNILTKFCKLVNETYENVILPKDDPKKVDHPEARFTISSPARQHLALLFSAIKREIGSCDLPNDTNIDGVIAALEDRFDSESVLAKFLKFRFGMPGKTLREYVDPTGWVHSQVVGMLQSDKDSEVTARFKGKHHLVATISSAFDEALRALSWWLSTTIWMGVERVISSELFLFALRQSNVSLDVLQGFKENVRVVVKKVRAKIATSATAVLVAEASAPVPTAAEVVANASEPSGEIITDESIAADIMALL